MTSHLDRRFTALVEVPSILLQFVVMLHEIGLRWFFLLGGSELGFTGNLK